MDAWEGSDHRRQSVIRNYQSHRECSTALARTVDGEEVGVGLGGDGLGDHGLAATRGAIEQHTTGGRDTHGAEELRMTEGKLHLPRTITFRGWSERSHSVLFIRNMSPQHARAQCEDTQD